MRIRSLLAGLTATCVLSSCAFLLDFDELQTDTGDASAGGQSGDSGLGGGGGASGSSGSGGGGQDAGGADGGDAGPECAVPGDCNDQDSLTSDDCVAGTCKYAADAKLVEDGFQVDTAAPYLRRVTLAAGGSTFYLSTYRGNLLNPTLYETAISSFSATGTTATLKTIPATALLPPKEGGTETPVSAVGMMADTSGVHAFFATTPGALQGNVWYARLDGDLVPAAPAGLIGNGYSAGDVVRYPVPGRVDNDIVAYWIAGGGDIKIAGPTKTFSAAAVGAQYAAPLFATGQPSMFMLKASDNSQFFYQVGAKMDGLKDCNPQPNTTWGPLAVTSPAPGLAFVGFSSSFFGGSVSEVRTVACDGNGCAVSDQCDTSTALTNGRNPALDSEVASVSLKSGVRIRVASVLGAADGSKTSLGLVVSFLDIGSQGESFGIYPTAGVVVEQPGNKAETADLPAVSLLGDRVAVAWIDGKEGAQMLHVRRYRLAKQ